MGGIGYKISHTLGLGLTPVNPQGATFLMSFKYSQWGKYAVFIHKLSFVPPVSVDAPNGFIMVW